MSQNPKTVEINLFSPLGITILSVITIPIFGIVTLSSYFPETWDATIIKLGLARYDNIPSTSVEPSTPIDIDQAALNILNNVTQSYGYSRFIGTWGMGTQGLFLPEASWNKLSESDKQILIQYAQRHNLRGIVVGKQLSTNNISLDYTVWGE